VTVGGISSAVPRQRQARIASNRPHTVGPWLSVGWVVLWLSLLLVMAAAIGRSLPVANGAIVSQAEANDQAQADGPCPALNRYGSGTLTVVQLDDIHYEQCPTLSEPQRDGN
jgi:hypothetical protein